MHLVLALAIAVQSPASRLPSPADTAHLVIVATTDVHGRVLGWDYVQDTAAPGGLSRAATILETLRAQYPGQVILLDAGDLLQGNPFAAYFSKVSPIRPHPIVDALNALGYDAATAGNHDFDFGVDLLQQAAGDATYRYVSANVTKAGSDTLLFPESVVLQRGGVRVGVTGFTTPGVMVWDRAQLAARARVWPIANAAPLALRRLEQAGADLKIVLIHSGLDGPSSYDTTGVGPEDVAASLATVVPQPDLVIVGHNHREMRDSVINDVHFVQPMNWARSLSVVHYWLVADSGRREAGAGRPRYRVVSVRADLIPTGDVAELPRVVRRLQSAHERARAWAASPLGLAGPGFQARLARAQDTPLLDFINEVQRRRAGAELSATTAFDLDAGLPEGEVRLRDVAGIYPYENTLRAVRISGQQLKDFLEHSSRYYRTYTPGTRVVNDSVPGYDFDAVSGARYSIDLTRPVGQRIRDLSVGGRPFAPGDSFTLALNSYRQAGGGGYTMVQGARVVYDRGEDIRDLLAEEIRRAGTVTAGAYFTPNWSILSPGREAALAAFAPRPVVSEADSTLLRVLAIADFHGALAPRAWPWSEGREVGGAAALKTWLDSLAHACGCATVRLDAGDQMQGTPISNFTYGRSAIDVMNQLGIDAAAIGNHEFDWSVDTLRARMRDARYQFVSANITDTTGSAHPDWAEPWTVVSRGGLKVAVIGFTLQSTPTSAAPWNVRGLAFGGAEAIKRVLPEARAAADFVIVAAHEGAFCDSGGCRGEIIDLARQLDSGSVDLIVAGHTHRVVNTRVNGIPVIEAGSSGGAIAIADFVRVGGNRVELRTQVVTPFTDQVRPDSGVAALVARYQRAIDSVTSRPVAQFKFPLRREGGEYALGRLIADAQRNMGRAEAAIMNNTGIRADVAGGTVTYGDLFQVQPFQNRLLRLTVSGAVLLEALEQVVSGERAHVSGVEVWYDPARPAGRRITRTKLLNGRPVDPRRTYTLAVTNFLAAGGSGFGMLRDSPQEDLGLIDLDALIRYLSVLRSPIDAPADPRIHRSQ
ncbi:MAG: 5'-nucleotidase C-terminal domain-containing protein [Gemmatimonadetes bacterium]|nr:5'-nucleotidase C-terminal domain-containing protein [Gemmatimonadota bacterium]